jgi:cell division protein FtsL
MSSYVSRNQQFVSRRQNWSRNQNTVPYVSAIKLGPVAHTVIVVLMVTVLGLVYLTQATKTTAYDYQSNDIDQKISTLSAQKEDLEIENAKLTSLDTTKNSSVASEMTTPSVEYANN